jgi:hypothetical protein
MESFNISIDYDDMEKIFKKSNNNLLETYQNSCPDNYIPITSLPYNSQYISNNNNNGTYYITNNGGGAIKAPGLNNWPVIIKNDTGSTITGIINKHTTLNNQTQSTTITQNIIPDEITFSNLSGKIPSLSSPTNIYSYCVKPPVPTPITNIIVSNQTGTSFTISWSGGINALSYTFTINGTRTYPTIDNSLAKNSVTFSKISSAKSYAIVITAININGSSIGNTSIILPALPSELTNFIFSNQTLNDFTVTWSGGVGATSYTYNLNGNLVIPSIDNGLINNSITFTGLKTGIKYILIVNAINSNGTVSGNCSITLMDNLPTQTSENTNKIEPSNNQKNFLSSYNLLYIGIGIVSIIIIAVIIYMYVFEEWWDI